MKVILLQDVRGQGKKGQLVQVSDGYARNYLFPRKMAIEATADNVNTMRMNDKAKQEKEQREMLSTMQVGDTVLTTSGFYGVVIDITEDTVIVEFGNNKNCRIPMRKSAIADVEKASDAIVGADKIEDKEKK